MILYVLTNEAPKEPATNTLRATSDTYMKWLNDYMTVRCVMRAIINDELSHKFDDVQSEEIIQILNESFSTPKDAERYKTSCTVFNVRMRERASVIDHVLYMIKQIEHPTKFGFSLYE